MLNKEFFFWISGWFDLSNTTELSESQWEMVKNHLELMLTVTNYCPSIVAMNLENNKQLSYLCKSQIMGERPNEHELMYYVQGFFEISGVGSDYRFNNEQINQIAELFLLNNTGISPHCTDIFINIVNNTGKVKELLNNIFEHAIDVSYGLSEEEMIETAKIHSGH